MEVKDVEDEEAAPLSVVTADSNAAIRLIAEFKLVASAFSSTFRCNVDI